MNTPPISPVAPTAPNYKDRYTGLQVFGVLEILLGGLAALMIPLMLFGQMMASRVNPGAMGFRPMIQAVGFYALVAAMLVWVGIGSFQARRWARALSLIIAWSWLFTGVFTVGFMGFTLPTILKESQPPGQAMPPGMQLIVQLTMFGFLGSFFILVPAVFVCFERCP